MTDTAPEMQRLMRDRLMSRSGEQRFVMGAEMFEAARMMVLASLPEELPESEKKRQLFVRIYGVPLPSDR
jgi:hypothetical protein